MTEKYLPLEDKIQIICSPWTSWRKGEYRLNELPWRIEHFKKFDVNFWLIMGFMGKWGNHSVFLKQKKYCVCLNVMWIQDYLFSEVLNM